MSQLLFKVPRPAPKALYTVVPEGVDGQGGPLPASKLRGAAWVSAGTGAASGFGFPDSGGTFPTLGTMPSDLD